MGILDAFDTDGPFRTNFISLPTEVQDKIFDLVVMAYHLHPGRRGAHLFSLYKEGEERWNTRWGENNQCWPAGEALYWRDPERPVQDVTGVRRAREELRIGAPNASGLWEEEVNWSAYLLNKDSPLWSLCKASRDGMIQQLSYVGIPEGKEDLPLTSVAGDIPSPI